MRRRRFVPAVILFGALVVSPRVSLTASDVPAGKPIGLDDIIAWKTIGSAAVSNDGRWLAYRLSPHEGDGEIVIRST